MSQPASRQGARDLSESERDHAEKIALVVRWMHGEGHESSVSRIGERALAVALLTADEPTRSHLRRRLRISETDLAADLSEARQLLRT